MAILYLQITGRVLNQSKKEKVKNKKKKKKLRPPAECNRVKTEHRIIPSFSHN